MVVDTIQTDFSIWLKVLLDRKYFEYENSYENIQVKSRIICGVSCEINVLCNIWCHDGIDTCTLSTTIVSPNYVEKLSDSAECFTRKRRDLIVGSTTYSSEIRTSDSKSELSADGVFHRDFGFKFETDFAENPWIIYNLKKPAEIFEILVISGFVKLCNDLEIRVGDNLVEDGDFSTYRFLVNTADPCKRGFDNVMHFKPPFPINGQYVALIRIGSHAKLSINHIEVDGRFYY